MIQLSLCTLFFLLIVLGACTPKHDVKHDQEMERIKQEVSMARGDRADMETMAEELKVEISRVRSSVEEHSQLQRQQYDEIKKDLATLATRIQALEQREVAADEQQTAVAAKEAAQPKGYDAAKRFFDDGKYAEAVEALNAMPRAKSKSEEGRKAQFLLAESYFMAKEYATAALEFGEFKKNFPKDKQVATATYRQANAFRNMGKAKEARLFYQELIEKHPKSSLVAKAKQEMKKLK